jgi:hypothetical protein
MAIPLPHVAGVGGADCGDLHPRLRSLRRVGERGRPVSVIMNLPSAAAAAMPRWASRLILLRAVMGQVPICLASAISLEGDRAMILKMSRSVPSIRAGGYSKLKALRRQVPAAAGVAFRPHAKTHVGQLA